MPPPPRRGLDLFRLFGVQIGIDYSWLIIFALVLASLSAGYFPRQYPGHAWAAYALIGLTATLLFFASVLIHELSHATVANRLGERVDRITLFLFGGMAHLSGEPRSATAELKIAAVGPLTSVVLGGLFWLLAAALRAAGVAPLWAAPFEYLGFVNVALAIFNLLPGFPLDGGRLLRAALWRRSGDLAAATRQAANWGGGIATGLMVLGALQIFAGGLIGGLWLIFIGMFLRGAARASYEGMLAQRALAHATVRDLMEAEPRTIPADATVQQAIDDYFLHHGYGGFPVVDAGEPIGLLSLSMVQRCPPGERGQRRVREVMRPLDDQLVIAPDARVADALERMAAADSGRLVVRAAGRPPGLITRSRVLRFLQMKTGLDAP